MHFQSFDNLDDMFAAMAKATEEANSALSDTQRAITYGSCWVRFAVDLGIIIFGKVATLEEITESERLSGSDDAELAATLLMLQENHMRGYMFGTAYSIWEPQGELGDTHRANMWPITEPQFEMARAVDWNPAYIEGRNGWLHEAYEDFRAWAIARFSGMPPRSGA